MFCSFTSSAAGSASLRPASITELPERFEVPVVLLCREPVPKDVQIAVVCSDLEVLIVRTVPLIQHFLNEVVAIAKPEADWAFVGFLAGIAFDLQGHSSFILA